MQLFIYTYVVQQWAGACIPVSFCWKADEIDFRRSSMSLNGNKWVHIMDGWMIVQYFAYMCTRCYVRKIDFIGVYIDGHSDKMSHIASLLSQRMLNCISLFLKAFSL